MDSFEHHVLKIVQTIHRHVYMHITDTDWSIKSVNPVALDLLIHCLPNVQRTKFQLYSGREVTFPMFKILISMTHRLLKFRRFIHGYIQILHLNLNG